jgi:hypothetical protein
LPTWPIDEGREIDRSDEHRSKAEASMSRMET